MKKFAVAGCLVLASGLCWVEAGHAVEWAIVGARAVGMGGAGVAVTTDSLATYWNPAGLAMTKTIDIRVQGAVQVTDRLGIADTLKDTNDVLNTTFTVDGTLATQVLNAKAKLDALVAKINQPGASVAAAGAAGLYFKGYWGDHAFGFNVSDVATGGLFAPSRLTAGCQARVSTGGACSVGASESLTVNGTLQANALEARQAGFSYAYAFADRTFAIGVTAKIIQGVAYSSSVAVQGSEGDLGFASDLGKAKTSTALGVDVGAMYRPSSWLRMGIVAKDINQPTFDAPGGGEFKLTPQVRGGIAVNPWETLTVTMDADVTSNKTLVPDIKSRVISLGAEQTIFSELLSLRLGAFKNTADANSYITPTAGFGIRLFALRVDVGGGYDFRERSALASGTVAMTF
jgi:hypothetical protein